MEASEYQKLAARTLIAVPDFEVTPEKIKLSLDTISVAVEAAASVEIIKKGIFHQHGFGRSTLSQSFTNVILAALNANYTMQGSYVADDEISSPIPSDKEVMVIWNIVGMLGEAGEVARSLQAGEPYDLPKAAKEIGDACWYLAALCTTLGLDLGEIMAANIEKLKARYPDGYNSADSLKRVDVQQ